MNNKQQQTRTREEALKIMAARYKPEDVAGTDTEYNAAKTFNELRQQVITDMEDEDAHIIQCHQEGRDIIAGGCHWSLNHRVWELVEKNIYAVLFYLETRMDECGEANLFTFIRSAQAAPNTAEDVIMLIGRQFILHVIDEYARILTKEDEEEAA